MQKATDRLSLISSMIAGAVMVLLAILVCWLAAQPVAAAAPPVITAFAVRWEPLPIIDEMEILSLDSEITPTSAEESPLQP